MAREGKSLALVTGANRGLGLETSRQLAQRGFRVILTSRDAAQGQRVTESLAQQGLDVMFQPLDVTDAASVAALAGAVREHATGITALVNNAGVSFRGFDTEVVRKTLAVNFFGVLQVTDALLPLMTEQGRLVMVSSGMGELSCVAPAIRTRLESPVLTRDELIALVRSFVHHVETGQHEQEGWPSSGYRVSKVALNAFTRIVARELASTSILVNAVCPGWVRTSMGGPSASRSVEEGADTIVWAATLPPDGPHGGFFRTRRAIPW